MAGVKAWPEEGKEKEASVATGREERAGSSASGSNRGVPGICGNHLRQRKKDRKKGDKLLKSKGKGKGRSEKEREPGTCVLKIEPEERSRRNEGAVKWKEGRSGRTEGIRRGSETEGSQRHELEDGIISTIRRGGKKVHPTLTAEEGHKTGLTRG